MVRGLSAFESSRRSWESSQLHGGIWSRHSHGGVWGLHSLGVRWSPHSGFILVVGFLALALLSSLTIFKAVFTFKPCFWTLEWFPFSFAFEVLCARVSCFELRFALEHMVGWVRAPFFECVVALEALVDEAAAGSSQRSMWMLRKAPKPWTLNPKP